LRLLQKLAKLIIFSLTLDECSLQTITGRPSSRVPLATALSHETFYKERFANCLLLTHMCQD